MEFHIDILVHLWLQDQGHSVVIIAVTWKCLSQAVCIPSMKTFNDSFVDNPMLTWTENYSKQLIVYKVIDV